MRTKLTIPDELLEEARCLSGLEKTSAIVNEALRALIQRESARRLARLGGTEPGLAVITRRKSAMLPGESQLGS
jgi:Arc/MetJ family transcription regulator